MIKALFTIQGKRRYLTADEQERSIAANKLKCAEVRAFFLTLAFSGC